MIGERRREERISWTMRMTCASCSSSVGQDHVCWHISSLETLLFRDSLLPLFASSSSSSSFLSPSYACLNCLNASIERKSNKNEKFRSFSICPSEKKLFKTRIPSSFQIDFEVSRERWTANRYHCERESFISEFLSKERGILYWKKKRLDRALWENWCLELKFK